MEQRMKYVSDLAVRVANDPDLAAKLKSNPVETIARVAATPLETDVWIYRMVVGALGLVSLSGIVGGIVLAAGGRSTIPEGVVALASAGIGALAGLLAPSPAK